MGDHIPKKNLLIATGVLILVGIIFIVVSLIGTAMKDDNSSDVNPYTNEAYISSKEAQEKIENTDIYENLDIVVNNLYDFVKVYRGDLETKDYTNYIKNLNKNFANLYSDINASGNAEKYFKDNKSEITQKYGIETYTDFEDLVDYIEIYKTSGISYKDVTIEKDSVEVETNYTTTKVDITYSNDVQKTINIDVINDSTSGKPEFVISF
jgi:hypothetical protein